MRHGAELVLHGHTHTATLSALPTPAGHIPVIGAPSASELNPSSGRCARYNIYRLQRVGLRWNWLCRPGLSRDLGRFIHKEETTLSVPYFAPTKNLINPGRC